MSELVIDVQLAVSLGLLADNNVIIKDCENLMALGRAGIPPPLEDPPCPNCRAGASCWFHRAWLPGGAR